MLNIPELEKRWLRYKIKSSIPYAVISLISIIVLIVGANYLLNNSNTIEKTKTTVRVPVEKKSHYVQKETPKKQKVQPRKQEMQTTSNTKTVLKPSMNFLHTIKNEVQTTQVVTLHAKPQTLKKTASVAVVQPKPVKQEVAQTAVKLEKEEVTPNYISIKRRDTKKDIHEIIKRFKKNHNPALSLFVAKKYYELGEYKKAYNYALITNQINQDIEDSWIVFAKSLVKLNQKQKAIKTLKKYIDYSSSSTAQILLNEIQSGKFK